MVNYKLLLPAKIVEDFTNIPETGMGYHKVIITLLNNTKINGTILNCEILKTNIKISYLDIKKIELCM